MKINFCITKNVLISKAIKNFGWLLTDKIIKLSVGFFLNVFIARYLGPDSYGQLAFGLAFISFFQAAANLGIDALVVRDLANKHNKNLILISAIKLRAISALFFALLAGFIATQFYVEKQFLLFIVSFAIAFPIADVIDLWFQSQSRSKVTIISKLFSYSIVVVFKFIIIYFCLDKILLFVAVPLEYVFSSVFMVFSFIKYGDLKLKPNEFDSKYIRRTLKESWPLALSSISIIIFMRSGSLFIENKIGFNNVGIYSIGVSLAEIVYFIPMIMVTSFAPILAKAKSTSEYEYKNLFERILFMMIWGSVLLVAVYGCAGFILLPYLYGASYEYSKFVFLVQIFTLIPVSIGCCQSLWIINEGRSRVALYQTITGALVSLICNYFLIDTLGVIGASVSTLISQIVQSFIVNYFCCKDLFVITLRSFIYLNRQD